MAALELEGKIIAKLPAQSGQGARGSWERQDFVIEYPDGNFTANACFSAWGSDKVADLGRFQVGDSVRVSFNVKGREYNGRWYNDLRVWRISAANQQPSAPRQDVPVYEAPVHGSPAAAPAYEAPAPSIDDLPGDSVEDDLPF